MNDSLFFSENSAFRKIALLSTIPCSIGLMMFASSLIMNSSYRPMFFEYDSLLALPFYLFYTYGLYVSFKLHRKIWPMLLFGLHVLGLIIHQLLIKQDWLVYGVIVSILLTSVWNQYLRTGSAKCNGIECVK